MQRTAIEATIRAIYAARAAGDTAALMAQLTPDACYRVAGDAGTCAASAEYQGEAMRAALDALNRAMPVQSLHIARLIIDGENAAAEVTGRLVFAATGEEFVTQWTNLYRFRDGKVADVVEYIDTARLLALHAGRAG